MSKRLTLARRIETLALFHMKTQSMRTLSIYTDDQGQPSVN